METIDIIIELLKQKGVSGAQMSRELGFSNAVFSQWKNKKQKPSAESLQKMAEYFGVSVDMLLTRSDKVILALSKANEVQIDERFASLPPDIRYELTSAIEEATRFSLGDDDNASMRRFADIMKAYAKMMKNGHLLSVTKDNELQTRYMALLSGFEKVVSLTVEQKNEILEKAIFSFDETNERLKEMVDRGI